MRRASTNLSRARASPEGGSPRSRACKTRFSESIVALTSSLGHGDRVLCLLVIYGPEDAQFLRRSEAIENGPRAIATAPLFI